MALVGRKERPVAGREFPVLGDDGRDARVRAAVCSQGARRVRIDPVAGIGDTAVGVAARRREQLGEVGRAFGAGILDAELKIVDRSEEHTSELQSLMRISYAVFCLKKKQILI